MAGPDWTVALVNRGRSKKFTDLEIAQCVQLASTRRWSAKLQKRHASIALQTLILKAPQAQRSSNAFAFRALREILHLELRAHPARLEHLSQVWEHWNADRAFQAPIQNAVANQNAMPVRQGLTHLPMDRIRVLDASRALN